MDNVNLQISMAELQNEIKHIRKAIDQNATEHGEMKNMIADFIRSAERKYAPMWVALVLKFTMGAVFLIIIGAFMSLIITQ